ncbi:Pro-kumamolisin, activation domain-containing protein [Melanogaster broomeanus]|nr:Pro-kumamolisin, activation domain-containing protein [Melanogaster broomeanus]
MSVSLKLAPTNHGFNVRGYGITERIFFLEVHHHSDELSSGFTFWKFSVKSRLLTAAGGSVLPKGKLDYYGSVACFPSAISSHAWSNLGQNHAIPAVVSAYKRIDLSNCAASVGISTSRTARDALLAADFADYPQPRPRFAAEPSLSPYILHEKRSVVPAGWALTRRHDATSTIPLRFALKQRNLEDIATYLYEVSHPDSPGYGNHWSAGDVARKFAPTDETIDTVRSWLISSGISDERIAVGRTKGWIQVDATVEEAERLMNTEYNVYTHSTGKEHVACEAYHLPQDVQPHVDFVIPTVHFDTKLTRRSGDSEPARDIGQPGVGLSPKTTGAVETLISGLDQCDEYITPTCLRALYGLNYTPVATAMNSYGIVEYTPQAYLQTDLQMFAMNFSTDLIGKEPYMVSIDGGYAQTKYQSFSYNGESDLDLQFGMSLVTGEQTVTLYQTGDMIEGASFNNFLDAIDGSYCTFEGGDDYTQDAMYPDTRHGGYNGMFNLLLRFVKSPIDTTSSHRPRGMRYCGSQPMLSPRPTHTTRPTSHPSILNASAPNMRSLVFMGVTVLYSSGDYGVAGNGGDCLTATGTQTTTGTIFNPSFPGTCPYITSVGATQVKSGSTVYDPEMACMEVIYSGGGFSNYFAMPEYQQGAVDYYLTNYYPDYPATIWNSTGMSRGFPDISANGANYVVAVDGQFELVYGTRKTTIGFINPTIYSAGFAGGFNDITEGTNPGCGTAGYNATAGWDPVTGLGTPNFPKLLEMWLALP